MSFFQKCLLAIICVALVALLTVVSQPLFGSYLKALAAASFFMFGTYKAVHRA